MGTDSGIQWTDHTWNPWHGCTKVSAGCKFCYMYRDKERYGQDPTTVLRSSTTFRAPLKTGKHHWPDGSRVFTCSWSDWFIEEADAWRPEAWEIIKARPGLTFQILTKRPERIRDHLPPDWCEGYRNVWLGVSVEDQAAADKRMQLLARVPAAVRFLSVEPLIDGLTLGLCAVGHYFQWVIVGGESGARDKARPCDESWVLSVVDECQAEGIPVFVKQLGSFPTRDDEPLKLRDSHGGNPDEWPDALRVRQFPTETQP
jgi:protein gp37